MSKIQKHIDLLTTESNKHLTQLEKDDYTVNELINAHEKISRITNALAFLRSVQAVLDANDRKNSRIIPLNGKDVIN